MPEPQSHCLAAGLCLICLCDTAGEMIKAAYLYTFTLVRAHKNAPLLHALLCSYVIGMCFLLDPSKCAEVVTILTRRGTFSRRLFFHYTHLIPLINVGISCYHPNVSLQSL